MNPEENKVQSPKSKVQSQQPDALYFQHVAGAVPASAQGIQLCASCGRMLVAEPFAPEGSAIWASHSFNHAAGVPLTIVTDRLPRSRFIVPCYNGSAGFPLRIVSPLGLAKPMVFK